jgi:hypothetical protein
VRSVVAVFVLTATVLWLLATVLPDGAAAAVSCPNANPIVNENNCMGAGSSAWQISNGRTYDLAGFATQTSYNLGQNVPLEIGAYSKTVDISVYRMGYYGGKGGRLVASASNVPVNNSPSCNSMNAKTGEVNCENWEPTYTIPGSSLPATGVYLAKIVDPEGDDNQIIFIVREDNPTPGSEILVKIPTATYQAYNWFGSKSLYNYNSSPPNLADGAPRAFSVSFLRPFEDIASGADENWFLKVDYPMVYWLEKEGYDVSYTDSVAINEKPELLLKHKILLLSGHDEYWSGKELAAVKNAREHGVNIASFSSNTAYWKVEYENDYHTMTTYKTVQDGSQGINDPGPEGPTTTFRDPGAPAGSPNAPPEGRRGPDTPENSLFGIMYVGDTTTNSSFGLTVPPAEGQDQYSGDSIWRNTGINPATGATIGTNLVGWEWDAIPSQPGYLAFEPAGVIPLSRTNVDLPGNEWLQDYGMEFGPNPPPGQNDYTEAVKYRAPSGALVFASGTMQWSWGLGPHFLNQPEDTYTEAPVESSDPRIQQATYNILSEMGVQPQTPTGVVLEGSEGPPTAALSVSPTTVIAGQNVTLSAAASYAVDGASIVDYKWDLEGTGNYSTDTGSTPTLTHSFSSAGSVTVGLEVTDSHGHTATTSLTITVQGAVSGAYAQAVLETPGISNYWRLDETSGSTFADIVGGDAATITGSLGSVTLGQPGAIAGNSDTAASFDGVSGAAQAPVNLSGTSQVTVEFWLKWNKYENNDSLAMELTPNFNTTPGGFLVDPNASDLGGKFAVGIGMNGTRNNVFFARPSAGVWHYYAFVLNTTAPGATEITPYVDGEPVAYSKIESGTGAGAFADSTLNFMSRDATSLFGAGTLDEVALYSQDLSPETILHHYEIGSGNSSAPGPSAAFTTTPTTVHTNQPVTFEGSSSTDPDGTITDYKWDLEGSGTYATDTGSTPSVTHTYTTPGPVTVGLKVTDSNGQTSTITHTIEVEGPTTYQQAVLETPGVSHYWRLNETSGSTLADMVGSDTATIAGEPGSVTLGQPGALAGESNTAVSFNGVSGTAQAPVNLSATSKLTIEFWLKWNKYENNDALAMEFTPNFNSNPGGFLIDPSAPEEGGEFAVGIGEGSSRNNIYFARPSAGVWHYYAIVINTLAPAASEITPYVDGQAVPYTKLNSGTGAGTFANSTLNLMSRGGSSLFGAGTLDDVALYNETLTPATILNHYQTGIGIDTTPPTGGALTVNGTAASTAGTSSVNTSGSLTIARTEYTEAQTGNQSGLASSTLTVLSAPLEGGTCGTFGSTPTTIEGNPTQTVANGCYRYTLTGTDKAGNSASISTTVKVDTTLPATPALNFSGLSSATYYKASNNTLYFNPTRSGGFTVMASSTDGVSGIAGYTFSPLSLDGFAETQTGGQNIYAFGVSATAPASPPTVYATNGVGAVSANATYNLVADSSAPTGGALTVNGVAASAAGTTSFDKASSFTIGTRTEYNADTGSGVASSVLTRAAGTLSKNTCGSYGTPVTITGSPAQSGLAEGCYLYTLTGTDNVGNTASISTTVKVDTTAPAPTLSVPADANGAVAVTFGATDAGSGVNTASGQLKRATATYTAATDTCGTYGSFANIGSAGPSSPYSDTTVSTGHCYEYEYTVSDLAGNSATSAIGTVKVNTSKPALTGIVDTTPGSTAGLPQVGDAITLQFSDPIAASSIPSSVTLTYARAASGSTTVTVSGLGSGSWNSGDSGTSRYSNVGGTSATVTATTLVSGTTVKLTVSAISDPSKNLTAGGPGVVSGTVNAAVKDVFGNTASTSAFTTSSVKLF